jgi:putative hydrolase
VNITTAGTGTVVASDPPAPDIAASPDTPLLRANADVAARLDEIAELLDQQGSNPFRSRAYRRAAETVRALDRPAVEIVRDEGLDGLDALPNIGPSTARAIRDLATTGRHGMLDRLRGASDPVALLATVPGVGPTLARRLHDEEDIETLEQLEAAAHDGRLERVEGFGAKRVAGIRDALASRLGKPRRSGSGAARTEPTVAELLDVDAEYLEGVRRNVLPKIAPRRFNPRGEAWLPVLHTRRGPRHYTALFSNTALAHRLHRTDDWVVLYFDGANGERQHTVVTATSGPLKGKRVIRGREAECETWHESAGRA